MLSKEEIAKKKGILEKRILESSGNPPVGIDEVGRGCIAGPVVTAAVVIDYHQLFELPPKTLELVRDSKKLSRNQRAKILPIIHEIAIDSAIGKASVREVEKLGIMGATFAAMHRAIAKITANYSCLLVDGNRKLPDCNINQECVVGGDSLCYAIAAASIIAKEHRDAIMVKASEKYPEYGFDNHVGYGTKKHMDALEACGVTPVHRKNFAPVARLLY